MRLGRRFLWWLSIAIFLFGLFIAGAAPFKGEIGSHSQWVIQKNDQNYTGFYLTYWPGNYTIVNFERVFHRTYLPLELLFGIAVAAAALTTMLRYIDHRRLPNRVRVLARTAKGVTIACGVASVLVMLTDAEDAWRTAAFVWVMSLAFVLICGALVRKNPPEERRAVRRAYEILIVNLFLIGLLALLQPSV